MGLFREFGPLDEFSTKTSRPTMAKTLSHVSSTLFVRNLPYSATKQDLESIFENVGPLKQCFVVTEKGVKDRCRGFGYVTFALREDAEKAVQGPKTIQGRTLRLDFASKKPRKKEPARPPDVVGKGTEEPSKEDEKSKPSASEEEEKGAPVGKKENGAPGSKKKGAPMIKKEKGAAVSKKEKKKKRREVREAVRLKEAERERRRSRLIVRNLPFKCSEEKLKSTFGSFGTVSEVSLPVNEKTSKKLGFGFVQFEGLKGAARAVKHMNGKEIMGRVVAVDWTLPRAEYLEAMKTAKQGSSEGEKGERRAGEDEDCDDDSEKDEMDVEGEVDCEEDEEEMDESEDAVSDEEGSDELEEQGSSGEEDDDEDDDDDDKEEEEEEEEDESEETERAKGKRPAAQHKNPPEDVHEGKTLFIRNVPFESTDDDVREIFSPFGNLEMCRVVIDPMTEHSRGTAFVKYSTKEEADECLKEGDGLRLSGRLLAVSPAISRSEAVRLRSAEKEQAKEERKDKRNLHLLREGMIRPGTKAAEGLSEQYLSKRLRVESMKKEKLKNLSVFVSPTRLALHNLPKAVDDKRLRQLAREGAGDKSAKVIEARIMRDLQRPSSQGTCKSLGFGFVEFSQHSHALNALLHLNNNAELFGPEKRPIVGFSLENRRALEIKEKRREKARMKHGIFSKEDKPKPEEPQPRKPYSQQRQQQTSQQHQQQQQQQRKTGSEPHLGGKSTMVMPQGGKKKGLPRHFGAKNRWRDRGKAAEAQRRQRKERRMVLQRQVWSSMRDPRPAPGATPSKSALRREKQKTQKKRGHGDREEKQFNAMVNKYKQKLTRTSGVGAKKGTSKWFDT